LDSTHPTVSHQPDQWLAGVAVGMRLATIEILQSAVITAVMALDVDPDDLSYLLGASIAEAERQRGEVSQ
jgi:hypothetical protein